MARRSRPNNMSPLRQWALEAVSLVAATVFLAVMVGLLFANDGKPVSSWTLPVTLNAVVSILSIASKSCLLLVITEGISQWKWVIFSQGPRVLHDFERIDAASRGPYGSACLLLGDWRGGFMLRLGAIVTVLAMALDPMTQQIIQTREEARIIYEGVAQVSATDFYYQNGAIEKSSSKQPNGSSIFTYDTTLDLGMQSAILYGINKNLTNIQRQAVYTCLAQKCEWEPYKSLSVCHECNDVPSSSLTRVGGNASEMLNVYLGGDGGSEQDVTAFQLPNGQFIANPDGRVYYSQWQANTEDGGMTFVMSAKGTGSPNKTLTLQHRENLIWAVSILNLDQGTNYTSEGIWPNIPLVVKECGVYWCVNQYDSRVENNTLFEVVTEVSAPRNKTEFNAFQDESLEFPGETTSWSPLRLILCVPGEDQCFMAEAVSVWALNNHFKKAFLGNITVQNAPVGLGPDHLENQAHLVGYQFEPYPFKGLWNLDKQDLQETFQNLAYSMANHVRESGADPGSDAMPNQTGRLYTTVTVFVMQWPYIILHFVTAVLGTVFIQLTAIRSTIDGAPVYKSSAVAVLSCKSNAAEIMEGTETLGEVEERSRDNEVHLKVNGKVEERLSVTTKADPGKTDSQLPASQRIAEQRDGDAHS